MTDHQLVTDAVKRAIEAVESAGYEAQLDVLLVFAAYCEQRKILREAGIIPAIVEPLEPIDGEYP